MRMAGNGFFRLHGRGEGASGPGDSRMRNLWDFMDLSMAGIGVYGPQNGSR